MKFVRRYIVRFDLPLNMVSIENNAEGIVDCHYWSLCNAFRSYLELKKANVVNVDFIEVLDGEEFCLM